MKMNYNAKNAFVASQGQDQDADVFQSDFKGIYLKG
jgi:hypothetical protein